MMNDKQKSHVTKSGDENPLLVRHFFKICFDHHSLSASASQLFETSFRDQTSILQVIFDNMAEGVVVADKNGKIVFLNRTAESFSGSEIMDLPPEKRVKRYGIYLPDQKTLYPMDQLPLMKAVRGEEVRNAEVFIRNARKPEGVWLSVDGWPIHDAEGEILGGMVISRDITKQHMSQADLRKSELSLQSVLDNTTAVIYIKDKEGRYLLVNRAFEKLFHRTREEMLRKTDYDIFPKNMADAFRENDRKVLKTQQPLEFEEVAPHDDGPHTYISVKFPLYDAHQTVYAMCGISTDISDRKRAEEKIQRSAQYLDKIINSIGDPIFVKDREHRWVLLNDAYCRFMGYRREGLIGKSDYDFFSKKEADVFWAKDEEVFTSEKENFNEESFTDAKGIPHVILTRKTLFEDSEGEKFIVGTIRDITERKQAQDELMQKNVELARIQAEREYLELFAYVASHDLQEPLQKIMAFGGLLKTHSAQALDEKGRSFLERMEFAAMRMSRMLEDLLQFTKVTMGADVLESVDLEEILGEVLSDLDLKISKARAKIEIRDLPSVQADRRQMHQLFLNLVANALKFQKPNGTPHVTVEGRPSKTAGLVEVAVKDNGIGFDEKHLERIFRPFERIHPRDAYEGSGIGLAICQKIAKRHGGSIRAQSQEGKGSTFFVTLQAAEKKNLS